MFGQLTFSVLLSMFTFYMKIPKTSSKKSSVEYKWNKRVDELVEDPQIKDALLFRFNMVTDIHSIKVLAAVVVGHSRLADQLPQQKHFLEAFKMLDVDSKAAMLQGQC